MKLRKTYWLYYGVALYIATIVVNNPATLYAATKYVDKDASGANNGTSWANAYQNASNALAAAADGDEFWVADGLYASDPITISVPNVSVYGGFNATESARSSRNWTNNVARLDGSGNKQIMLITGTNVTVDGVTLQFGYSGDNNGGAIKNSGADLKVQNTTFTSNYLVSGYCGGGIYNTANNMQVSGCVFSNSYSGNWNAFGLGIWSDKSFIVQDSSFITNYAGDYHGGSAIFIDNSSALLTVSNCYFLNNVSKFADGGENLPRGCGGAICINQGSLTVRQSAFVNNWAQDLGGAIWMRNASGKAMIVENCTFYTNRAHLKGGGAICGTNNVALGVTNSIFWNNTCGSGAGLEIAASDSTSCSINYSSLTATSATYVVVNGGTLTVTNTIVGDPLFVSTTKPYDVHEQSTSGHWTSGGWVNDGASSPCIDGGNPTSPYSNEPTPNGSRLNMGAYGNTYQASKCGTPMPDIEVFSNTTDIVTGDITPSAAKGTHFGSVTYEVGAATNTFTITNSGDATLYLTNASIVVLTGNTSEFSVNTNGMSTNIAASSSTTFKIVFDPTSTGMKTGVVTIASSDSNEDPYYFCIKGLGTSTSSAPAGIMFVDAGASGANNGTSWTDAYTDASNALAAATNNAEYWVSDGIYISSPITISSHNVGFYGGFTGTESARSSRNWTNNVARLDGGGNKQIMLITGTNVTVDGVTLQFGYSGDNNGGAIKNSGADLKVQNTTFTSNYLVSGYCGGGIYNTANNMQVSGCVFSNSYSGNWNAFGLGIWSDKSFIVQNSSFITNYAGDYHGGSAIFLDNSSALLTVSNCYFLNNVSKFADGGENLPRGCGGAICINQGSLTVRQTAFVNNWAQDLGGAIWMRNASGKAMVIQNCTFYTNRAHLKGGGAICGTNNVALGVTNSIFWNNTCGSGAGLEIAASDSTSCSINYSLLTATSATYVVVNGGTLTVTNTIVGDPLFVSTTKPYDVHEKSKNGHWTVSGWVNDGATSPCIDTGDPASAYDNEPSENGGRINMGAYGNTLQASKSTPADGTVIIIE